MLVFKAKVIWPGKEFENTYGGETKKRTSATFLPEGKKDENNNYVRVNSSDPKSKKALLLNKLKKGQDVYLIHAGNHEGNPFYDVAQFLGSGLLPNVASNGAAQPNDTPVVTSGDEIDVRADLYVAAAMKLIEKGQQAGIVTDEMLMGADQISMWAASIAKSL